jgi:hypothetical protein
VFILKVVRGCTEIVQIPVVRSDPALSDWIEERGGEIFYTEGTEFAEVTENWRLGTIDARTLEPRKEIAAGGCRSLTKDGTS